MYKMSRYRAMVLVYMRRSLSFFFGFTLWLLCFLEPSYLLAKDLLAEGSIGLPKADCHIHLVDFLQNGEYWSELDQAFIPPSPKVTLPSGQRDARIVGILKRMDAAGVTVAMVSGMPFVKKWSSMDRQRPLYYLDNESRVLVARDTDYIIANSIQDF